MLKEDPSALERDELPEVEVKKRRGISLVWLIPLVAGAIAIWLAYTTLQEKGPQITVMFDNAEGLEAGKTQVKYRNVEVGLVDEVALSEDLSHIVRHRQPRQDHGTSHERGHALLDRAPAGRASAASRGSAPCCPAPMSSSTPVKASRRTTSSAWRSRRRSPQRCQGPSSFCAPTAGARSAAARPFTTAASASVRYSATSWRRTSQGLIVKVFVDAPNDQLVRPSSRFWNASGVDVSLGTDGVDVSIESLEALLAGGIAFDTPDIDQPGEAAAAGTAFPLFASLRAVTEAGFTQRIPYLVHFDGSVRGLRAGAPVEFRGIRVGTVTDVRLEIDASAGYRAHSCDPRDRAATDRRRARCRGATLCRHGRPGRTRAARAAEVRQPADRRAAGRPRFPPRQPAGEAGPQRHLSGDSHGARPAGGAGSFGDRGLEQACGAAAARRWSTDLRRTIQGVDGLVSSPDTKQAVAALTQAAVRLEALIGTLDQRARAAVRPGAVDARFGRRPGRGGCAAALRHERSAQGADRRGPVDPRVRRLPRAPP